MEKPNGGLGILARALICLLAIRRENGGSRQRHIIWLIAQQSLACSDPRQSSRTTFEIGYLSPLAS